MNITWLVFQFIWFAGCGVGVFVLTLSTLFLVIFYILSTLLECDVKIIRPNATLFVVGFSSCYVVYLSWSALASHPDKECNEMIDSSVNTAMQIIVGVIFTFLNMFSIATASEDVSPPTKGEPMQGNQIIQEKTDGEAEPQTEQDKQLAIFPVTFQTMFYQIIMVLLSLYFGMLFTNWGYALVDDQIDHQTDNALFSMWVKIVAQIITIILFSVSALLYCCCPDRSI